VRGECNPQVKRGIVRKIAWKDDCKLEKDTGEEITTDATSSPLPTLLDRIKTTFTSTKGKKRFVIFVGDGSNDAGVLSQADLGVSFQSGTNLANAAADVILLSSHDPSSSPSSSEARSDLWKVLTIIDLSKSTKHRIVACFLWALMYNFLAFMLSSGILVVWRLEPQWAGVGELVSLLPVFLIALTPPKKTLA